MIHDTWGHPCIGSTKQIGKLLIILLLAAAVAAKDVDVRFALRRTGKSNAGRSLISGIEAEMEAEVEAQAKKVRSPLIKIGNSTDIYSEFAIFTPSGVLPASLPCLTIEFVAEVSKQESLQSATHNLPPKGSGVSVENFMGIVLLCSGRNDAVYCKTADEGPFQLGFPLTMYLGPICPKPSRRILTNATSDEYNNAAASSLAVLPADHPFTLWSHTAYGTSTCILTWSGPTCAGVGERHSWDWQDFDGLMFGYSARNLALS